MNMLRKDYSRVSSRYMRYWLTEQENSKQLMLADLLCPPGVSVAR